MISYQNQPRSLKQRSLSGEGGLTLYLPCTTVCSLDIASFLKWGISLKWILWQSKLKPGYCHKVANAENKNLSFGGEREGGFTQGAHREGKASPSDVRFVIYPNV